MSPAHIVSPAVVGVDGDAAGDARAATASCALLPKQRRVNLGGVGADLLAVDERDERGQSEEREGEG